MQQITNALFYPGYTAAWAILDNNADIIQYRDPNGKWLKPADPSEIFNLYSIVQNDTLPELEQSFQLLQSSHAAIRKERLNLTIDGQVQPVNIEMMPLPFSEDDRFLVLFQPANKELTPADPQNEEEKLQSSSDKLTLLQFAIQQCQEQLTDLSNYTEAIIDTVSDLLLILDKDLRVVSATKPFYDTFKTTESDIEGKFFYELESCPWENPGLIEKLQEIVLNRTSFAHYEINCTFPSIGERVLLISCRQLEKANKEQLILISIEDITTIRQEKNELIKTRAILEERMKLAVEATGFGTWEMDPVNKTIVYDNQCRKLFGFGEEEELDYESFRSALLPEDRKNRDETLEKTMAGYNNGIYDIQYRILTKNTNELRWIKSKGKVFFGEDGKAKSLVGTMLDITREKVAEQLLKESEERFRLAADAAAAMIWLSGKDKMYSYFNKSWLEFTGRKMEEEAGKGWMEGILPEDLDQLIEAHQTYYALQQSFTIEYRLRRNDGNYRWVSESGVPRFSADGIFEGYVGTCIDIHDQKMMTEELEQSVAERTQSLMDAINELEESNQNLEEFAYAASHDLQEPLRKIVTFANRLSDKAGDQLTEQTKIYLTKITESAARMSVLIDALLNYSRLRKAEDAMEPTDLTSIVKNVLKDFDLAIQQKKGTVNLSPLPTIRAVPLRMSQLFHNLVSNALKFSKPTTAPVINIRAVPLTEEARVNYPSLNSGTEYSVILFSDNGIGFNQEFAEKIFLIFQRLNGVSEYEGTGIGLAISRKIVINHHGLIFASSVEGEGTEFKIIFPLN
ncbi:MAG: PAS domain-containing protein [Bacteroidota bacterium]